MTNEMQRLSDRIAEKVGKELVDLIPPDQWKSLIEKQIAHFKEHEVPKIINQMLTERLKEDVKIKLDKYCLQDTWNQFTGSMTNEAITQLIKNTAPEIVASMLSPIMSQIVQDFRGRLGY